ncbi:MAG: sodium:alanine symporter family protein [Oscillospiraceae bacterium]|nr:sodium:alanine symporter family protein [Oscillospiraceae bacterium]
MSGFNEIISKIDGFVWGIPMIVLILGCGIILTFRIRGLQVRRLGTALKFMFRNENSGDGEVTSFAALCTALSATIGTGNIVGVATAIAAGGPGALLWMEVAAFFGMATKYSEGLLAVKYRVTDKQGHILGGPFYYIENGMGQKWKWLAKLFAIFGTLAGLMGIGTITQINGITSAANNFFDPDSLHTVTIFGTEYTYAQIVTGLVITLFTALILIGGIKRIASASEVIVPVMAVMYILCCLIIILTHIKEIPSAVAEIISSAFGLRAAAGGALGAIIAAMQNGISRGIFSNEAGLGSAPIAAAAAQTKEPARQGLVTMTGTFIDTIIVCTMTGLSIVISGCIERNPELKGVEITNAAFQYGLPFPEKVSSFILMACLVFFAFTTILGWNYYSERCLAYLTKSSKFTTIAFRCLYIAAVFIGPYLTVEAVWNIADIFNGLMAIPNIIALICLSGVVSAETKKYISTFNSKE